MVGSWTQMRQRLPDHGGTAETFTLAKPLPLPDGTRPDRRTGIHGETRLRIRARSESTPAPLRGDIPGALDHHTIAYSDVPIADFILIVEVARLTSTPPTFTGSNSGHRGQNRPSPLERYIQQWVVACCAGNFHATANRGARAV